MKMRKRGEEYFVCGRILKNRLYFGILTDCVDCVLQELQL